MLEEHEEGIGIDLDNNNNNGEFESSDIAEPLEIIREAGKNEIINIIYQIAIIMPLYWFILDFNINVIRQENRW